MTRLVLAIAVVLAFPVGAAASPSPAIAVREQATGARHVTCRQMTANPRWNRCEFTQYGCTVQAHVHHLRGVWGWEVWRFTSTGTHEVDGLRVDCRED